MEKKKLHCGRVALEIFAPLEIKQYEVEVVVIGHCF